MNSAINFANLQKIDGRISFKRIATWIALVYRANNERRDCF